MPMKKQNILIASVFIVATIYLVLRSFFVPIVHDEAATFFHYIIKGEFIPWIATQDANNHILNTILEIGSYRLFGMEPWALRLPNVLSFFLFLWALFKVSRHIKNQILSIGFVIVMIATQGFFEFFALGRGYGLSMALLMTSFWMVLAYIEKPKLSNFLYFILSISLATLANLTLIPSALIMFGFLLFVFIFSNKSYKSWSQFLAMSLLSILFLLIIAAFAKLALVYQTNGVLYYGSNNGFYETSLKTMYDFLFPNWGLIVFLFSLIAFSIALVGYFMMVFREKLKSLFTPQTFFLLLFLGNVCGSIVLNKLLGVHYGEDRTVMYLYPIIIGFIFFGFTAFAKIKLKAVVYGIFLLLIIPIHFVVTMNISYSSLWKNENIKPEMFEKVWDDMKMSKRIPTVTGEHIYQLIWLYYNIKHGEPLIKINHESYPNTFDDFVLSTKEDAPLFTSDYNLLDVNNDSGIYLFKRKSFCATKNVKTIAGNGSKEFTENEFLPFIEDTTILSTHLFMKIRAKFELKAKRASPACLFGVKILDSASNTLKYIYMDLGWLGRKQQQKQLYDLRFTLMLNEPKAHRLKIYLWNTRKTPVQLSNYSIEIDAVNIPKK
jgi:hypothetical protein